LVGNDNIFYQSIDGGKSWYWIEAWGNDYNDICFISPHEGWVVGDNGVVLRTFDGGLTWEKEDLNTEEHLFACDFHESGIGFIVGDEGTVIMYENKQVYPKHVTKPPVSTPTSTCSPPCPEGYKCNSFEKCEKERKSYLEKHFEAIKSVKKISRFSSPKNLIQGIQLYILAEDAHMYVDDMDFGTGTHLYLQAPAGIHTVRLSKPGRFRKDLDVLVTPGEITKIYELLAPLKLELNPGIGFSVSSDGVISALLSLELNFRTKYQYWAILGIASKGKSTTYNPALTGSSELRVVSIATNFGMGLIYGFSGLAHEDKVVFIPKIGIGSFKYSINTQLESQSYNQPLINFGEQPAYIQSKETTYNFLGGLDLRIGKERLAFRMNYYNLFNGQSAFHMFYIGLSILFY